MLAVILLGVALVPMLRSMADTGREAGFSESYLLAHARVQSILDSAEAVGWLTLPKGQPSVEVEIPPSAGPPPDELKGPAPDLYAEVLFAEQLEEGLVRLTARVRWLPSSLGAGRHMYEAASVRLLRRADGSWTRL